MSDDSRKIQGVWRVVSPAKLEYIIPISDQMLGSKVLYQLNDQVHPKQIDMQHRRPRARPRYSAQGIYHLTEETLTICWNDSGQRPAEFPKQSGTGRDRFLVLRRMVDQD